MKVPIIVLLLAIVPVGISFAQQAPVATPAETRAAQGPPAGAAAVVDPSKMAAPSPSEKKPQSVVDDNTYVLGPEDQIMVTVYRNADFTGSHLIRPDGRISINLVGEVDAAGLTPEKLGIAIAEKLKAFLVEPNVTVSVLKVH